jgi:nucleotidyltransferase/DNA polymerase involved in DNA repair
VFVKPRVNLDAALSRRIRSLFERFTDEAFLDVAGSEAPNKFVAKIASDLKMPDVVVVVQQEGIRHFLDPLPVGRIWGVGKVTGRVFEQLGVGTIGELRLLPEPLLDRHRDKILDGSSFRISQAVQHLMDFRGVGLRRMAGASRDPSRVAM